MRTGFVLTARRKAVAIMAGVGLCALAVPVVVLADGGGGNNSTDTCGYPDSSNLPNSKVAFNESGVMAATIVVGSGTSAKVVGFATDEKGLLYGVTGNDPAGRPENPELWVTDITSNPTARTGDWQQGGAGVAPNAVYGDTTNTVGTTPTTQHSYWAGLPYAPPAGLHAQNYNAEVVWNASSLGLVAGHNYRFQDMTHDGDQNNSGGDVGEDCNPLGVPMAALTGHIYNCANGSQTAAEVPGGTITFQGNSALPNPVSISALPGTYTANATAPSGYQFVTCGSTNYTPGPGGTTASYVNPVPVTASVPGQAIFFVAPNATFSLTKSVTPSGPVAVGTPLQYFVTVTNNSATLAGDPGVIKDTPSATTGLAYALSGTPHVTQGTATVVSTNPLEIDWTPGPILPHAGESLGLTLIPTAAGSSSTPALTNTAYNPNTNCPTPGTTGCTTVTPLTNFSLAKSVSPTGAQKVGTTLTYTVTAANLTTTAGDPGTVLDTLTPNGVTYTEVGSPVASAGSVTGTLPSLTWHPGTLAGNASATLTVVIQVTGVVTGATNPSIANTAFDTTTNCPTPNTPSCTTNTPVPSFTLAKSVSPSGAVTIGDSLTYTVTETNITSTAGDGGTVDDTLTANGVSYTISSGPTASQGAVTGGSTVNPGIVTYHWAVGNVAANGHATLTMVIKVTGVTPGTVNPRIINTAVNTQTNCATANNPTCTTTNPLVVITLNKTVSKTTAVLGDTLTYTVTVGNTGAAPAANVLVDDLFGGDAGYTVNDGTNGTVDSFVGSPVVSVNKIATGHYQWTLPLVSPGDHDVVTFTVVISAPAGSTATTGNVILTNTVAVPTYTNGTTSYTNPGNNPSPVTVSTVAPFSPGGVQALTSPATGAVNTIGITAAGFLLLGGIGLILLGVLAQTPATARRRQS